MRFPTVAVLSLWVALWVALPAWADARLTVLMDLMRIDEGIVTLRAEGIGYGQDLNLDMLDGQGGAAFARQVEQIFDAQRMHEAVRQGLAGAFTPDLLDQAIAFYATETGAEIAKLETAARAAISDPEVEEIAVARTIALEGTARIGLIERLISGHDLLGRNVTASMNDQVKFMQGLADGGALDLSEDDILAQAMADRDALLLETENWLFGFFVLAYSPLTDEQIETYVQFCDSAAGHAMNNGLFDGFGAAYGDISYALGRVVALNMAARDL